MNFDRPLPNSPDAERVCLGIVFHDNSAIEQLIGYLNPEDFYVPSHQLVYEVQIALFNRGSEISAVLVAEELKKTDSLEKVGGFAWLIDLGFGVPSLSVQSYAEIVKAKATYRSIIKTALQVAEDAFDQEDEAEVIVERATASMLQIERYGSAESDFRPYSEIAQEATVFYEGLYRGQSQAVPTGYHSLDKVTRGGIYPGEVRVIMAKTGDGKSAWMIGSARYQAQMGYPVAIISLEMSDLENFARAHSALSGVAAWKIQPQIWKSDYDTLQATIPDMGALPIWSASASRMANVYEMRRQVRELVLKHKIRVLYVDYLQLADVTLDKKNSTRALEISTITRTLKLLAKELNIGVVELSQPSQEGAKSGKVKTIHNRESTAIGNDADIVVVIDMPEDRENLTEWDCAMRIDKHRNGPKVSLTYRYNGATLTFSEGDEQFAPPPLRQERQMDWNAD